MTTSLTHVGLDVHKETIAVAVLRPGDGEPDQRVIANTPEALRKIVSKLGPPEGITACYEAGPTGYAPPSAGVFWMRFYPGPRF